VNVELTLLCLAFDGFALYAADLLQFIINCFVTYRLFVP